MLFSPLSLLLLFALLTASCNNTSTEKQKWLVAYEAEALSYYLDDLSLTKYPVVFESLMAYEDSKIKKEVAQQLCIKWIHVNPEQCLSTLYQYLNQQPDLIEFLCSISFHRWITNDNKQCQHFLQQVSVQHSTFNTWINKIYFLTLFNANAEEALIWSKQHSNYKSYLLQTLSPYHFSENNFIAFTNFILNSKHTYEDIEAGTHNFIQSCAFNYPYEILDFMQNVELPPNEYLNLWEPGLIRLGEYIPENVLAYLNKTENVDALLQNQINIDSCYDAVLDAFFTGAIRSVNPNLVITNLNAIHNENIKFKLTRYYYQMVNQLNQTNVWNVSDNYPQLKRFEIIPLSINPATKREQPYPIIKVGEIGVIPAVINSNEWNYNMQIKPTQEIKLTVQKEYISRAIFESNTPLEIQIKNNTILFKLNSQQHLNIYLPGNIKLNLNNNFNE